MIVTGYLSVSVVIQRDVDHTGTGRDLEDLVECGRTAFLYDDRFLIVFEVPRLPVHFVPIVVAVEGEIPYADIAAHSG